MGGLVYGAMSGGGSAAQALAVKGADYLEKSNLQAEAAKIQEDRDARLAEIRKGEMRYGEDLRREPGKKAQEEIDAATSKPEYDAATDSTRPRTPTETSKIEEKAYRNQGLVNEAMAVRNTEQQRQRDVSTDIDRREGHAVQRESIAATQKYHDASLRIQAAAENRLATGSKIENDIKTIQLGNAQQVEKLRKEFSTADAARKHAITEEIQIITGKDNDNFLPVPMKDETGAVTGYQILDKKRGTWVTPQAGAPGAPGPKGDRPPIGSFFKGGPPAPGAPAPAARPATAPAPQPAPAPDQPLPHERGAAAEQAAMRSAPPALAGMGANVDQARALLQKPNLNTSEILLLESFKDSSDLSPQERAQIAQRLTGR